MEQITIDADTFFAQGEILEALAPGWIRIRSCLCTDACLNEQGGPVIEKVTPGDKQEAEALAFNSPVSSSLAVYLISTINPAPLFFPTSWIYNI